LGIWNGGAWYFSTIYSLKLSIIGKYQASPFPQYLKFPPHFTKACSKSPYKIRNIVGSIKK
jgi:hypothetical protein